MRCLLVPTNVLLTLNSIEERVLALIGQVAIEGLPEVRIPINLSTEEVASANTTMKLKVEVDTKENFQPPSTPSSTHHSDQTRTTSLTQREYSQSQTSSGTPRPSNQQRLRRSRPMRRDPNVPHWAYELELKRIEAVNRRTAVAEKQVEVQLKILTEMRDIKLELLELTATIKEKKT